MIPPFQNPLGHYLPQTKVDSLNRIPKNPWRCRTYPPKSWQRQPVPFPLQNRFPRGTIFVQTRLNLYKLNKKPCTLLTRPVNFPFRNTPFSSAGFWGPRSPLTDLPGRRNPLAKNRIASRTRNPGRPAQNYPTLPRNPKRLLRVELEHIYNYNGLYLHLHRGIYSRSYPLDKGKMRYNPYFLSI